MLTEFCGGAIMKKIGLGIAIILFGILFAVLAIAWNFAEITLFGMALGIVGLIFAVAGFVSKNG